MPGSAGPGTLGKGTGALLHRPLAPQAAAFLEANAGEAGHSRRQLDRVAGLAGRRHKTTGVGQGPDPEQLRWRHESKFAVTDPAVSEPSRRRGRLLRGAGLPAGHQAARAVALRQRPRARERRSGAEAGLHEQRARRRGIVDSTLEPAEDPAALDVFVEIWPGTPARGPTRSWTP